MHKFFYVATTDQIELIFSRDFLSKYLEIQTSDVAVFSLEWLYSQKQIFGIVEYCRKKEWNQNFFGISDWIFFR